MQRPYPNSAPKELSVAALDTVPFQGPQDRTELEDPVSSPPIRSLQEVHAILTRVKKEEERERDYSL